MNSYMIDHIKVHEQERQSRCSNSGLMNENKGDVRHTFMQRKPGARGQEQLCITGAACAMADYFVRSGNMESKASIVTKGDMVSRGFVGC